MEKKLKNENFNFEEALLEEIDEQSFMLGINGTGWTQLSPVSDKWGNKGAVCTYTVECVNNCRQG